MNITTVLLTGATGSIGQAIADTLARYRYRIIASGRNEAALHAMHQRLGQQLIPVVADITRTDGCRRLAQAAEEHGASVLINNAGINRFGLFAQGTITDTERQFRTNLVAPVMLTQMLLPRFLGLPQAHILNIGATLGGLGYPGYSVYCASKFGLRGFSEALMRELADSTVCVNYLAPRTTRSALHGQAAEALHQALGHAVDEPAVVAETVAWLLYRRRPGSRHLGWPEKLAVRLNALCPPLINAVLKRQLPTIRRHARDPDRP